MKVLIPMAGTGNRFVQAGYQEPKPLISVSGKRIIEYILDMFDEKDEIVFICNTEHLNNTNIEKVLLSLRTDAKVLEIQNHKKGPIYTIMPFIDLVDDAEPVMVCYCDNPFLWNRQEFEAHLENIKSQNRPFVICGDWNIAHTKKDIKNWRGNQKNSGFLPEERAWLDKLFDNIGFIDGFRVVNQEEHQYTWWSNRGQAWANNTGWRIDYQVLTPDLRDAVESVSIYKEQRFSDHAPLIIDYKESAFV